eukprot:gene11840-biopygen22921
MCTNLDLTKGGGMQQPPPPLTSARSPMGASKATSRDGSPLRAGKLLPPEATVPHSSKVTDRDVCFHLPPGTHSLDFHSRGSIATPHSEMGKTEGWRQSPPDTRIHVHCSNWHLANGHLAQTPLAVRRLLHTERGALCKVPGSFGASSGLHCTGVTGADQGGRVEANRAAAAAAGLHNPLPLYRTEQKKNWI